MAKSYHELSQFKFLNHLETIELIANRKNLGEIPPVSVEIDPTNICNSGCWWCSTADTRKKIRKSLDKSRVLALLDELRDFGVKSVVFKGGGDPTMVPWIDQVLEHAGSIGLAIGMNTNGARMSTALHDVLLKFGSWIRFSVDAASDSTYQLVHRTNEWTEVIKNITHLVNQRAYTKSPLFIGINHNLDQYNYKEVPEMLLMAQELGVDYVAIRPVYWNIAPKTVNSDDISNKISVALTQARELAAAAKIEVKIGNVRNSIGSEIEDPGACLAPALIGIVCADGEVAACCDLRGIPHYSFGNIYNHTFREIWRSQRRQEVLDHTSCRECDPMCSHAYAYHNQIIHYIQGTHPQHEFL